MKKLLILATAWLSSSLPAAATQNETPGFAKGRFLPDLELPTIDGAQTMRFSELRGKKLLLVQFASW